MLLSCSLAHRHRTAQLQAWGRGGGRRGCRGQPRPPSTAVCALAGDQWQQLLSLAPASVVRTLASLPGLCFDPACQR